MSLALDGAVELLERALGYTRVALQGVDESSTGTMAAPTPCARWDLVHLLAHLDDALDAFTDAAAGLVVLHPVPEQTTPVEALREKAGALLGAWLGAAPRRVSVGDAGMPAPLLVAAAALEIAVHGWDVAQATGQDHPVPGDLAARLLGPARRLVGPADRVSRFGPPHETPGCAPDVQLLAYLGRGTHGHPGSFSSRGEHRGKVAS